MKARSRESEGVCNAGSYIMCDIFPESDDCYICDQYKAYQHEDYLNIPGYYRHFKGQNYLVKGISYPTECLTNKSIGHQEALSTADNKTKIKIHTSCVLSLWHAQEDSPDALVVYQAMYDDHRLYVREAREFLSKISPDREDNITNQTYRMEEIK